MIAPMCFLPKPTKKFSPQNGEKIRLLNGQKYLYRVHFFFLLFFLCGHVASFFLFFLFFPSCCCCVFFFFFPELWVGTLPLFSFSFFLSFLFFTKHSFFFLLFGLWVWWLFYLFIFLTRHDFFLGTWFFFLINWVIFFFFFFFCGCLSLFCFNWPSFFNKDIWVSLYKFTFFIPLLFHSQPNKRERN